MTTTTPRLSRREAITRTSLLAGAGLLVRPAPTAAAPPDPAGPSRPGPFLFCLNTGTIRGQKLGLLREIEVAAQAGYQAIEPWVETVEQYVKNGGSLKAARQRAADLGITVESAIGFPEWLVDDDAKRAQGLERARREMDLVAQLGGKRLATPPAGATNEPGLDVRKATDRYRALLEAGDQIGVVPQLELWGFSRNLNRLGECAHVAIETGHPKACVLADVFHLYKGGSEIRGLRLLSGQALQVFHMNDYPADPPRDQINDSYRVFPGDGVAPLGQMLRDLHSTGGQTVLSLELFNRKYWEQDPLEVARAGLRKLQNAVNAALA